MASQEETFTGFTSEAIKGGYFRVPNMWIDVCSKIDNLAELKVVLYVMRHTWGFQEYNLPKHITIDEFMHGRKLRDGGRMDLGTGLSNQSVISGLAKAVQHGYLICAVDASDRARIRKSYALRMTDEELVQDSEQQPIKSVRAKLDNRLTELRSMPYPEYLLTPEWQIKRQKALRFASFRCQVCNGAEDLNVHHRTYERLGRERLADLTVLCQDCHAIFHKNGELAGE